MLVEGSTVASKRPLEMEAKANNKRVATTSDVDTPTQTLSTPLARTEAASKRPSSASDGSEPSSANASAVSEAIQASSVRREPSPLASSAPRAPPSRTPPPSAPRAAPPKPVSSAGAAASAEAAVANMGGAVAKEVSYEFLRNKRDAQGRKEGEEGYDKSTLYIKLKGDERFTPGQQQYWDIKKHHADVVIFFKMVPHTRRS